jgi:hypothetical protein
MIFSPFLLAQVSFSQAGQRHVSAACFRYIITSAPPEPLHHQYQSTTS